MNFTTVNHILFLTSSIFFSQGLAISGALSYAVKQINKCSCLLPSVELDFVYKDTEGNEQISTESVVDLICK